MENLIALLVAAPLLGAAVLLCGGRRLDRAGHWIGTVLAAASLTDVFEELATGFEEEQDVDVTFSFGSSTDLAEQVADGAPGDVLATADETSMGLAEDAGVTEIRSRPVGGSVADGVPAVLHLDDGTAVQADLLVVGIGAIPNTELAEAAQVTKQTAGALVDQLERTGYVRRTPDPRDARARLVRIAERGAAAQPVAAVAVARVEAEWRAHLGERSWGQLRTALRRLREITDPYQ